MVGLSVLLESHENGMLCNRGRRRWTKTEQNVVNQTAAMDTRPSYSSSAFAPSPSGSVVGAGKSEFLYQCFLCKRRLLENEDIYMYMGEMAFCSEDCRFEHMSMEIKCGAIGQQQQEERRRRSSEKKVKQGSLFSADC